MLACGILLGLLFTARGIAFLWKKFHATTLSLLLGLMLGALPKLWIWQWEGQWLWPAPISNPYPPKSHDILGYTRFHRRFLCLPTSPHAILYKKNDLCSVLLAHIPPIVPRPPFFSPCSKPISCHLINAIPILLCKRSKTSCNTPPCPLHGLNITFPYKKTIIPLLFALSPLAKRIGAVNTLKKQGTNNGGDTIPTIMAFSLPTKSSLKAIGRVKKPLF